MIEAADMDSVLGFFERIPYSQEALEYLAKFRSLSKHQFAVIKVGGQCIEDSLDTIAMDIKYLNQLGLYPTVVFGWGNKVTKLLAEKGIESKFDDVTGDRITSSEAMEVIEEVAMQTLEEFYQKIYGIGVPEEAGTPFFSGRKKEHPHGNDLGLVGIIEDVDVARIESLTSQGISPIMPSWMNIDIGGEVVLGNVNGDDAAKELVFALHPAKYLSATPPGGILDKDGEIISEISILSDYDGLVKSGVVSVGAKTKLDRAKELVEKRGPHFVVEIVSARNMLPELFTKKGAGTYISLGYQILEYGTFSGLNHDQCQTLAQNSIGKSFVDGYFDGDVSKVYLEPEYKGILLLKQVAGVPYMCKFLVHKDHQGNGLGKKLFQKGLGYSGKLAWRADPDNPFNGKYFEWCERAQRNLNGWNVFSVGLTDTEWSGAKYDIAHLPKTME
jgi:acetylglutamate kinase/GNAT superfamily N-acetyltransferase